MYCMKAGVGCHAAVSHVQPVPVSPPACPVSPRHASTEGYKAGASAVLPLLVVEKNPQTTNHNRGIYIIARLSMKVKESTQGQVGGGMFERLKS